MLAVRLRIFLEWHIKLGHRLRVVVPSDAATRCRLAQFGVGDGLPLDVIDLGSHWPSDADVIPVARLDSFLAVEELATQAVRLLQEQTGMFGEWGDAIHMAVGELGDNTIDHGRNQLGAYAAADRLGGDDAQFRLVFADLGIGVPEHIRAEYPEWHDDTSAISQAMVRGVTGTGDPHRGNGFAEVIEAAAQTDLVRAASAADLDVRSGKGRAGVRVCGGNPLHEPREADRPRRGTWATYTVTTAR